MRTLARLTSVLLAAAAITSACSNGNNDRPKVALVAARSAGADPFTTTVDYEPAPVTTKADPPAVKARVSGTTPGLYGGTRDVATCNADQMVEFLSSHPAQAKAWADAAGVDVGAIGDYVRALTPVMLRVDTRVVNHGFKNGKANGYEAVLQAGTAVLVDNRGVPRVKCACGNPLLPSQLGNAEVDFAGERWRNFAEAKVTVVTAGSSVDSFELVDPATGDSFRRPTGGDGSTDRKVAPRGEDKVYEGTGGGAISVSSAVPFVVSSTVNVDGAESGYFAQPGDTLQPAGDYPDLSVRGSAGVAWRVVIRPLGPKYHEFRGQGETNLGSPKIPGNADVVTEFVTAQVPNGPYLVGANGLISHFSAVHAADVAKLRVSQSNGTTAWTLTLWGLPPHCGFDQGTDRSVSCGD